MIPEGKTIDDIKARETIIRNYYREWKAKNPSQRKFNLSLKEYINIRMVSIIETSEHAAKSYLYEKRHPKTPLCLPQNACGWFTLST